MTVTLAQAFAFDLPDIGLVISLLSLTVFLFMVYMVIMKEKVRNFFASNIGIASLVAVLLLKMTGDALTLPKIVADLISIVLSVAVYPVIFVGAAYLLWKLMAGTFTAVTRG